MHWQHQHQAAVTWQILLYIRTAGGAAAGRIIVWSDPGIGKLFIN